MAKLVPAIFKPGRLFCDDVAAVHNSRHSQRPEPMGVTPSVDHLFFFLKRLSILGRMAWRQSDLRRCYIVPGIVAPFLIVALPLHAQQRFLPVFHFNQIKTTDGLPSITVADVVRDKQGFIWIGTQRGLARYM